MPLDSEYKNNEAKIKETKEKLDKIINSSKAFNSEKEKLNLQIETLNNEVQEAKIIQTKTFEELDKTKSKKEDTYFKIQQAQKRIAILDANKNAYKSVGMGSGIETVLNARIAGVHEPLAQLAEVDQEYVDAINVAMGARAYSIVVDNQDVAYKAIQILRSQGRDRASFIPLSIIKKTPAKLTLPKEKGVIDFAINLIDFDDKYLDAFYFALGETIVVEGEATAKKLAGKYRVVTLDGDITEKSGLITGGAKKKNASFFDKSQEKELEKYKKALKDYEKELVELGNLQKDLERRLEDVRHKHSTSLNALNSAKIELKNLVANNESASDIIKAGEEQLKELKARNTKLSKELDLIENKHIKLKGYLVDVKANGRIIAYTSLSRTDSNKSSRGANKGGGACEIMYVEEVQIGNRIYR